MTTYKYRVMSERETSVEELDLAFLAAQIASFKLNIKSPSVRFIVESDHGYIFRHESIDGYCPYGSEIFIKTALPLARMIDVTLHATRHAWQWSKPGWVKHSDDFCEKDARLFVHEFWGERSRPNDYAKILLTLCEIGAPLAIAAGDALTVEFFLEELRLARSPLFEKYEQQCRNRDGPGKNTSAAPPSVAADQAAHAAAILFPTYPVLDSVPFDSRSLPDLLGKEFSQAL